MLNVVLQSKIPVTSLLTLGTILKKGDGDAMKILTIAVQQRAASMMQEKEFNAQLSRQTQLFVQWML